jgi:hypothetical protein
LVGVGYFALPTKSNLQLCHRRFAAEGGMCDSIEQFIQRYFKGNSSLEVWVIRFEFVTLDRVASTNTPNSLVYTRTRQLKLIAILPLLR